MGRQSVRPAKRGRAAKRAGEGLRRRGFAAAGDASPLLLILRSGIARSIRERSWARLFARHTCSQLRRRHAFARPDFRSPDCSDELAPNGRLRPCLNERLRTDSRSSSWWLALSVRDSGNEQQSEAKRCSHNVVPPLQGVRSQINLPTCWRAPDPPMRRTNQNRLIRPSIVPNSQFSAAWKTQRHDAGLIKFANFQIAIIRSELDR
jgi:hypothetical protein